MPGDQINMVFQVFQSQVWLTTIIAVNLSFWIGIQNAAAATTQVKDLLQLKQAVRTAQPGDHIQLLPGSWKDVEISVECVGNASQPILIEAVEPGTVVFSGRTRLRVGGQFVVLRNFDFQNAWHEDAIIEFRSNSSRKASSCTLTSCCFRDCNPADLDDESKIISLYGQDNRVTHCEIEGKRNRGATVVIWLDESPARHRLDRNYFGPRERLGKNGGETIRVGDSNTSLVSAQCRIEENLFEECNGEAEIVSNKSCDNIYAHNTFRRCQGALTLRHGHRCRVEGNYFLGEKVKGTGGVRIIGEDHVVMNNFMADLEGTDQRAAISIMLGLGNSPLNGYSPVQRAQVLFNTVIDCKQSMLIGLTDEDNPGTVAPSECKIIGNIFSSSRLPLVSWREPLGDIFWDFNCFWSSSKSSGQNSMLGETRFEFDPMLKRDSSGLARLSPNSSVKSKYPSGLSTVTHDIDGHLRQAPLDLGCDQLSAKPAMFIPLNRSDVGRSINVAE